MSVEINEELRWGCTQKNLALKLKGLIKFFFFNDNNVLDDCTSPGRAYHDDRRG